MADLLWVLGNLSEDEKNAALSCQSENLAIAFALINTSKATAIAVVKTVRLVVTVIKAMTHTSKIDQ